MQLKVKTVLNGIQPFVGFIYDDIRFCRDRRGCGRRVEITLQPHAGIPAKCSRCLQPSPGYDQLPQRSWLFPPLWGLKTFFLYGPRRVNCPQDGVVVEHIPWSQGKRPVTTAMMGVLARWARRLSWKETAQAFHTSWEAVYRSVQWFVQWGLEHRRLESVEAIGVDEIHWGKGQKAANFLTVIYQIDPQCRRLLWVGQRRTQATLRRGLTELGAPVVSALKYVCSDMWKPYLKVIAAKIPQALNVLDRFHIVGHLNEAVDEVRRGEQSRLHGRPVAQRLKGMRWQLLRRGSRVRGRARSKLNALLASKLATARAWNLKESFDYLWHYRSPIYVVAYLGYWCERAMRSRLEPMKKVARMLRAHEPLILNWFEAKGELSSAVVEGLNNKIRVVTRRSYGFRTYPAMELALYHSLGRLPEPRLTHNFC